MNSRSRTHNSVINMGVGFAGYFINTITGFVCRMVFVRCLPAEYLGISGLFTNILSMLSLAELGIGTAIGYALYKPLANRDEKKIAALMRYYGSAYRAIGVVVACIGIALLPFLKRLIGDTTYIKESVHIIYFAYLFNTCLTYFFGYRATLLFADQKNYISIGTSYIITTVQSILQIVFLILTKNYLIYIAIQTLGALSYNVIITHIAVKQYPYIKDKTGEKLDKSEKKALFINIKALTVAKLSEYLVNGIDNIIITYFKGIVTVGAASNYTLFSGTLSTLTNQIFSSMTASVGNFNALNDQEEQYSFFKKLQLANFMIFGWATIGIMFVSSDLVELCFGENYVLPISIPFVLALNFYLVTMQSAVRTFRATLGLFRYGQYTLVFTAAINLICSMWFGKLWGLFGIYFATAVARMLTITWYFPYAVFTHGFHRKPMDYFFIYLKYLVILFMDSLVCFVICRSIHCPMLLQVILKMIICSAVPNVLLFAVCGKTEEYRYVLSKLKALIGALLNRLKIRKNSV